VIGLNVGLTGLSAFDKSLTKRVNRMHPKIIGGVISGRLLRGFGVGQNRKDAPTRLDDCRRRNVTTVGPDAAGAHDRTGYQTVNLGSHFQSQVAGLHRLSRFSFMGL